MQKSLLFLSICLFLTNVSLSGQTAPNFIVTDSKGIEHNLYEDYLDQGKFVLLKIFFVDCPPCRALAPGLQNLYEDWGSGQYDVQFIELSNKSFDSSADIEAFKLQFGIKFPGVGFDGGALTALQPYIQGDFGPYYGAPEFVLFKPNRTLEYGIGGGSVNNSLAAIDLAIENAGAKRPGEEEEEEELEPTIVEIQVTDGFGNNLDNVDLVLASSSSSLQFPIDLNGSILSIEDLAIDYPGLENPIIKISKKDEIRKNLSALDILILVRHILGLVPITNSNLLIAADTNGDSAYNALDLIVLQKIILNLISSFPNSDSYQFVPNEIPVDLIPGETLQIQFTGIKTGDLNGF